MFVFDKDEAMRAFLSKRKSISEIAREAGIDHSSFTKVLQGFIVMPKTAAAVREVLGIEPVWVNGGRRKRKDTS